MNANVDSFAVNIVVYNLGQATGEDLSVNVKRRFPNGTIEEKSVYLPSPNFKDTLTVYMQTGNPDEVAGAHYFDISINDAQDIEEDCYANSIQDTMFIYTDVLAPISPCNFSIVNHKDITLVASTGQLDTELRPYKIEIDTTELFNSPQLKFTLINSNAGVIKWNPDIDYEDGRVYYWRTSQIINNGEDYNWQNSSFIYLKDGQPGWNQSHYYQYQKDNLTDIHIDTLRYFDYYGISDDLKRLIQLKQLKILTCFMMMSI